MLGKAPKRTAKVTRMAKVSTHGNVCTHGKEERRTAMLGRHGKDLCRAYMAPRMAKISLPFVTLSWTRCRAWTHGKGFALRFVPFAVRTPRTAKPLFRNIYAGARDIGLAPVISKDFLLIHVSGRSICIIVYLARLLLDTDAHLVVAVTVDTRSVLKRWAQSQVTCGLALPG
jgi:hypothetical protein